jgi:glycogen(starch) synthase
VLASVLKPLTDTRMFEKIGWSLATRLNTEVHIIGFPDDTCYPQQGFVFHPIARKPFRRISVQRLLAPWQVFILLLRIRPHSLIITTHELLLPASLYASLFRIPLYYDVQENYYRNIRHTPAFPAPIRPVLAAYVRAIERILSGCVKTFLLAEQGYTREMPFARPHIVLENKLPARLIPDRKRNNPYHLLFTGTLAPTTGVMEAIEVACSLHRLRPEVQLTIIGYAPQTHFLTALRHHIADLTFVQLITGRWPLPHHRILEAISEAGTGIIIYPPNAATENTIPTKVYEYLACGLPMLIRHNAISHALVVKCNGGLILEQEPDYAQLIQVLPSLTPPIPDASVYWESQEQRLLELF